MSSQCDNTVDNILLIRYDPLVTAGIYNGVEYMVGTLHQKKNPENLEVKSKFM